MKIPLIKPYINQDIKDRVLEVLDSGYLTEGPVTKEFEKTFKNYIGCDHAIAFTSCTTGMETALRCLGIGPGDEVIVPDYTYPATTNVAPIVGATSVIVDINRDTMLIDYDAIEEAITNKTKAIVPVSEFGNPLDYERLNRIKEKYGLYIIEDAACSVGAEYKGVKVGNYADISAFSLHPRKFITTGEGGMITTNNKKWADWMISYKHFGMGMHQSRLQTSFERIGTNYKMSNILAAIGLGQMKVINKLLTKRRELAANYIKLLENNECIALPVITPEGKHAYQSFCIFVENRDEVIKRMKEEGIETQIGTYALHLHKAFRTSELIKINSDLLNSKYAFYNSLTLPLYHDLSFKQQNYVVNKLFDVIL